MNLFARIEQEHTQARLDRDEVALSTLTLLKSEVVKAIKEGGGREIDDELVQRVALKELKRREEAASAFAGAGRAESAARERAEADVLRSYLPVRLTPEELEAEVLAIMAEVGVEGPRGFGQVMKVASDRLGPRAEGGEIAATVRRLLG